MSKLTEWINRQEKQKIKRLKARLHIETELRKKAEQLAYTSILAFFEKKGDTPPPASDYYS